MSLNHRYFAVRLIVGRDRRTTTICVHPDETRTVEEMAAYLKWEAIRLASIQTGRPATEITTDTGGDLPWVQEIQNGKG